MSTQLRKLLRKFPLPETSRSCLHILLSDSGIPFVSLKLQLWARYPFFPVANPEPRGFPVHVAYCTSELFPELPEHSMWAEFMIRSAFTWDPQPLSPDGVHTPLMYSPSSTHSGKCLVSCAILSITEQHHNSCAAGVGGTGMFSLATNYL